MKIQSCFYSAQISCLPSRARERVTSPKEILKLIENTVEVDYFIKPVINLKASSSYDSSEELESDEVQD